VRRDASHTGERRKRAPLGTISHPKATDAPQDHRSGEAKTPVSNEGIGKNPQSSVGTKSMSDPLATYLHDHLAGAALAIDLLKSMQRNNAGEPLGQFAESLLADIEADRDVLRRLTERVGIGSSAFKELTAWLSERVSRVKLGGRSPSSFGTFEALEFLQLGIHGKWALWQALAVVAATDERLRGTDFLRLATRAATQESQVEQQRLQAARLVFDPAA
jgi:hypothetical protein